MKKLLVLLTVLLTLLMGTAYAEKTKFKEANFNFKNLKTLHLAVTQGPKDAATEAYFPDAAPVNRVLENLRGDLQDRGLTLNEGAVRKPAPYLHNKVIRRAELTINVYKMGYDKTWKEPWDEMVTRDEKKVAKDEHGNDVIVVEPVQEMVHHPGEWDYHCYADVEFLVKDPAGRLIYSVRDTRDRGGQDYDGMLGRICKDFAKDVSKN